MPSARARVRPRLVIAVKLLPDERLTCLPTPTHSLGGSRGTPNRETARRRIEDEGRRGLDDAVALLPTPTSRDHKGQNQRRDDTCLPGATALLPTPRATRGGSATETAASLPVDRWGRYAAAIHRHEATFGREAPNPSDEKGRLAPEFVEWMVRLPAGWVTDVPGITRAMALRALGNIVVPPQAAAALRLLAARASVESRASA